MTDVPNVGEDFNEEILVLSEVVLWLCRTGFALRWWPDNAAAAFCPIPAYSIALGYAAIDPEHRTPDYWMCQMREAMEKELANE